MKVLSRVRNLIGEKLFSFKNEMHKYLRKEIMMVLRKRRFLDLAEGMREGFLEEVESRQEA